MESPRPLADVTPFAVEPPHLGGQVVIRSLNAALAAAGQPVEQFALGIRRPDLLYVGRTRRMQIAPGYIEWRRTEPVTVLLFMAAAAAGLPFFWAHRALTWRPWHALERSISMSSALMVEMPWTYAPTRLHPPAGVPLVYMAQNAEFVLAAAWRGRWGGLGNRLAASAEASEGRLLRTADLTVAISPTDAAALVERYGVSAERVRVLPRGLDLEQYQPLSPADRWAARQTLGIRDELVVVFAGSKHPPNVAAAEFLATLAPQLGPRFRCVIAGSVAPGLVGAAPPEVWLRPGDPTPWLRVADIAVNPMQSGSGMNIKMLQYLARALPVVTTEWGARGLAGQPGIHYKLAALGDMLSELRQLAGDPTRRQAIGQAGRRLVEKEYSALVTARQMLGLLSECRARLAAQPA